MENKIPFYNIVNMLLTGFVFFGCCIFIYYSIIINLLTTNVIPEISIVTESIITIGIFSITYEIGYIINRIGSIIIEPILIKTKTISFNNNYKKFNDCSKEYPILGTLSREYALSRTSLTLFVITAILALLQKQWVLALVFLLITLLFSFSCRKHAKKILAIVEAFTMFQ